MVEGFWFAGYALTVVSEPPIPPAPKPLNFYNQKLKDSRFVNMDVNLIAEGVTATSTPLAVPLGSGLSLLSMLFGEIAAKTSLAIIHIPPIVRSFPENPLARGVLQPVLLYCGSAFSSNDR